MRCFVGLAAEDSARRELTELQKQAAAMDLGARPVRSENFHLTLAFIGELSPEKAREVAQALRIIPTLEGRFWQIDRSGSFPRAKVCWCAGPRDEYLELLAKEVRTLLDRLGVDYDRARFKAHITLLRNSRLDAPIVLKPIPWLLTAPVLFESKRDADGVLRYTPIP